MNIQNRILGEVYFVTDTVVDWVEIPARRRRVFTRPKYKHIILASPRSS
ncbi:transposase (fragment) [uncultured Paludibacter sp.]